MRGLAGLIAGTVICAAAACSPDTAQKPAGEALISVRVAQIGPAISSALVSGVGTVALRRETALGFTTAGQIDRVLVNEGDRVRKGQVLAVLDATQVSAGLATAQAEFGRAQSEVVRSAKLFKEGWITRPRLDNAQAALAAASANVQTRRFAVETARIVAPNSGTILVRSADPSQIVNEGTPILVLGEDASGFVLRMPLNDRDVAKLSRGAPADVRIEALGGLPLKGSLLEIGGRSDRGTGSFTVEIALPADARLRSGLIGTADIITPAPTGPALIAAPASAILAPRAGEAFVYVVSERDRRARLRKVQFGETGDGGISIISGLSAGEWVAISSIDRLKDGQRVAAVKRRP